MEILKTDREREDKTSVSTYDNVEKVGQGSNGDIPTLNLTLRGAEEEDPLVVRSCTWPAFAAALGSLTSLSSGAWRQVDVDMIGWETDRSDGLDGLDGLDELDGLEGDRVAVRQLYTESGQGRRCECERTSQEENAPGAKEE